MGQVQNGHLQVIGEALRKMKKTKHEKLDFVHNLSASFFLFMKHNPKTIQYVKILCIPMIALLMEIIPTCFKLRVNYDR